jgi:hypothetical protein
MIYIRNSSKYANKANNFVNFIIGVRKILLGVRNCIKIGHTTHLEETGFEIFISSPFIFVIQCIAKTQLL